LRTREKPANRFLQRYPTAHQFCHCGANRQINAKACRTRNQCRRGGHTFRHTLSRGEDIREIFSAPKRDAERRIAAARPSCGQQQIAKPRKPGHRIGAAPEAQCQARDFCQAARDQRRARILSKTRAHNGAGSNRNHILGGATNFGTNRIIAAVKAKAC
jgi:hypothetical protein